MDRVKKEDNAYLSHLPRDPKKKQRAMMILAARPLAERLLDGWNPSYESSATPKTLKPKAGVKIAGKWSRNQGPLGSAFRITPNGSAYKVKFATWDRKGSETFFRNAVLKGAVLQLDRPVFDVVEQPFSKVYVVMVGKESRLLPSSDVSVLEKLGATPNRAKAIAGLTFHRS